MDDGPGIIFTWMEDSLEGDRDPRVEIGRGGGTRIHMEWKEKKPEGERRRNERGSERKTSGGGNTTVCR